MEDLKEALKYCTTAEEAKAARNGLFAKGQKTKPDNRKRAQVKVRIATGKEKKVHGPPRATETELLRDKLALQRLAAEITTDISAEELDKKVEHLWQTRERQIAKGQYNEEDNTRPWPCIVNLPRKIAW